MRGVVLALEDDVQLPGGRGGRGGGQDCHGEQDGEPSHVGIVRSEEEVIGPAGFLDRLGGFGLASSMRA